MGAAFTLVLTVLAFQSNTAPVQQPAQTGVSGFVYCSEPQQTSAPVFLDTCNKVRVGSLKCGEEVQVLERETSYYKVAPADKLERYMTQDSVSQSRNKLAGFTQDEVPSLTLPACKPIKTVQRQPPKAIYSPDPDYSKKALKKHLEGTVVLSLIVDAEGVPRDVHVTRSLGLGLDEEAIKAVRNWRFKPGLEDGKPVALPLSVEVDFRIVAQWHR